MKRSALIHNHQITLSDHRRSNVYASDLSTIYRINNSGTFPCAGIVIGHEPLVVRIIASARNVRDWSFVKFEINVYLY